jgi:O-antigen/teichoic acid export membrane protein
MKGNFLARMMGDTSQLVLAGIFVQLLNFLSYPILTRYYSASDFGIYYSILAFSTIIGSAICLRLDVIYQLAPKRDENDLLLTSIVASVLIATIVFVLTYFNSNWALPLLDENLLLRMPGAGWAAIIALLSLLIGLSALGRQIKSKAVQYQRMSIALIMRAIAAIACQLLTTSVWPWSFGLLFGFTIGLLVFLLLTLKMPVFVSFGRAYSIAARTLKSNRSLIRVDIINVLISAAILSSYPLVVIANFGASAAGHFAIASRLSFIPVEFLAASISTVFFQRFSDSLRENNAAKQIFWSTLLLGVTAGTLVGIVFWFLAEIFVSYLFEPEWAPATSLIIALIPTMIVRFFIGCIGSAPLAFKKPIILFYWNLSQVLILMAFVALNRVYELTLEDFLIYSGICIFFASLVFIGVTQRLISKASSIGDNDHAG